MNDCFAYRDNFCTILRSMNCRNCKFYKTHTQYKADREAAARRVRERVASGIFDVNTVEGDTRRYVSDILAGRM